MTRRWLRRLGVAAVVAALLAGCTSPSSRPAPVAAGATGSVPQPPDVQDGPMVASPSAGPSCDPLASLRPVGAQPQPGRMPAGSTMARIARRGRLVVGIDQNSYLFTYRDPATDQLVGFEADLAREIARAIFGDPGKVQFLHITTADRIPAIQQGRVDIVVRTMTMTCDRWQQVSFSTDYLDSHQRLLVNAGSGIHTLADVGHRKVCASAGSTSIVLLSRWPTHPSLVSTASTLDCLVLLQQGQVAAVSTDDTLLLGLAAQDPGTTIVGPNLSNEPSAVGIAKNAPDLVRFVNSVLAGVRSSGLWLRLYNRWLRGLGPATLPVVKYQS